MPDASPCSIKPPAFRSYVNPNWIGPEDLTDFGYHPNRIVVGIPVGTGEAGRHSSSSCSGRWCGGTVPAALSSFGSRVFGAFPQPGHLDVEAPVATAVEQQPQPGAHGGECLRHFGPLGVAGLAAGLAAALQAGEVNRPGFSGGGLVCHAVIARLSRAA